MRLDYLRRARLDALVQKISGTPEWRCWGVGPTSEPFTDGYSPDIQQHDLDGTEMEVTPECCFIS